MDDGWSGNDVSETANPDAAHGPRPRAGGPPGRDAGNWRRQAACRGEDPELFFPIGSTGPALTQIAEAKKICARCPVRAPCLRFALATGQAYGIWGGRTEDERRQLCRHRLPGRVVPLRQSSRLPPPARAGGGSRLC